MNRKPSGSSMSLNKAIEGFLSFKEAVQDCPNSDEAKGIIAKTFDKWGFTVSGS